MVGMGRRQQQGASLVEVLVVIGILAIAILAFIRLYPSGFLALKRSGQSDAATRYAQKELERLKARADNLPRAIAPVSYDFSTGELLIDPTIDPNDLGVQPNLPEDFPSVYASGVNRFRRIVGERVPLGLPGPTLGRRDQLTEGIVYTTLFAPIAQPPRGERAGNGAAKCGWLPALRHKHLHAGAQEPVRRGCAKLPAPADKHPQSAPRQDGGLLPLWPQEARQVHSHSPAWSLSGSGHRRKARKLRR